MPIIASLKQKVISDNKIKCGPCQKILDWTLHFQQIPWLAGWHVPNILIQVIISNKQFLNKHNEETGRHAYIMK